MDGLKISREYSMKTRSYHKLCQFFDEKYNPFQLHLFFYKQLGSGVSPPSCLYSQGFQGSKFFNGCLIVCEVTYVCEDYSNVQDSKSIFMISG